MQVKHQISQLSFPLQSFILDCESRGLRPRTVGFYQEHCSWFLQYARDQGATKIEDVSAAMVRGYLADLQRREWRPASVASAYRALRVFFGFLERDEAIAKSPMRKVSAPKVDRPLKTTFTGGEIKRLLAASTTHRDRALILFLLDTGARITEALSVNCGDIDIATGRVFLRQTKDREQRIVFLGVQARKYLIKHLAGLTIHPDAPVWVDLRTRRRLERYGVNQLLTRIGTRANVSPANPHRFRRTFAVSYLRNGGDIFTLQRILGHSTLEMVRKYLDGLNVEDTAEAHRRCAPGDRL